LKTVSFAERISQGDFTQTIKNNRKDEIGSLIGIVFNLGNVFQELKHDAGRLSDVFEEPQIGHFREPFVFMTAFKP
jgi:methyl-accepting chemotaxis protein